MEVWLQDVGRWRVCDASTASVGDILEPSEIDAFHAMTRKYRISPFSILLNAPRREQAHHILAEALGLSAGQKMVNSMP